MMRLKGLLAGVWDFFLGDDWRTALGVAVALAVTAVLADAGIAAWWVMPPAVFGLLALSARRALRSASVEDQLNRTSAAPPPPRPR
jgi:hypothetical protein